jgi:putative ABC transport system substrate-binding protein
MVGIGRRDLITLLGGAAAWPLAARAQQGGPARRVGILHSMLVDSGPLVPAQVDAFKRVLAGLGWAEGRNLRFEERWADNYADLPVRATQLARLAPDVIFVVGSPALRAMRRGSADIPVVFASVADPVEQGFVSSLAHPGGNITGFAAAEFGIATKQLDLLKKLAPNLERIAFLDDPAQPASAGAWSEIETAAPSLALRVLKVPVHDAEEIERTIATLAREPASGLFVTVIANSLMIPRLALRHRLPAVYPFRFYVESGGLVSYGPDATDLYRRAALYVDRILRGEKPRDLPVQLPTKFELVLNLKTARAMGLDMPPTLLAIADEVIE